ncbi:unnamed protein product, partial [Coregonus sp. 'balchen']
KLQQKALQQPKQKKSKGRGLQWKALKTLPSMAATAQSFQLLWLQQGEKFDMTGNIAPLQLTNKKWNCEPLPNQEEMNMPEITLTQCWCRKPTQGSAGWRRSTQKMTWN